MFVVLASPLVMGLSYAVAGRVFFGIPWPADWFALLAVIAGCCALILLAGFGYFTFTSGGGGNGDGGGGIAR